MRSVLMVFAMVFSIAGCKSTELMNSSLTQVINVKQFEQQTLDENINQWADSQSTKLLADFKNSMPMSINGSVFYIKKNDLHKAYETIEEGTADITNRVQKHKNNMPKLRADYNQIQATLADYSESLQWINAEFAKHASGFHAAVMKGEKFTLNQSGGYTSKGLLAYCKANDIDESLCKSTPYAREGNALAKTILNRHFLEANKQYGEHLQWVEQQERLLKSLSRDVEKQGVEFESKKFFKNASSNGCGNINNFNFSSNYSLASLVADGGFKPKRGLAYSLERFKIFQSHSGGVLLDSTLSNRYGSPLIFAATSDVYADGYEFGAGEKFVCYVGVKQYASVLGATRRVNSFKTINDTNKYYFIMVNL